MNTPDEKRERVFRTVEFALKAMENKDAVKDPSFSYRSPEVTTRFYCGCRDCVKFRCYGAPIKCIDPYLMDMRYTDWIYFGLVDASKETTARTDPVFNRAVESLPKKEKNKMIKGKDLKKYSGKNDRKQ